MTNAATNNLAALRQQLETANAHHRAGNIAAAVPIYQNILKEWPEQPDAVHMLAIIAQQMGNTGLALKLFDETVRIVPNFGQAWVNRATLLRAVGREDEAALSIQRALTCDKKLAGAWNMSGILLRDKRQYDEACTHHARAVELEPDNAGFQHNYASILLTLGRVEDAYQAARMAVKLNGNHAPALVTLGSVLCMAGYPERGMDYFRKAQASDARYIDSFINEGEAALLIGDFEKGRKLVENRKLRLHDERCISAVPRWNGDKIDHLLLSAEQGAGDNIQSMRYISLIGDRAKKLTLQVPASLKRVMASNLPNVTVISSDEDVPKADAFEPLMSLAYHCSLPNHEIPAPIPYIKVDEDWRTPWTGRLQNIPKPRVGFVWSGNPFQMNDHNRSMGFENMLPVIKAAQTQAVCLQKGPFPYDLSPTQAFDAAPWIDDFASTAGLMSELDLLITVDTSVSHLMGAMGKPVWVLLPFDPGWRYMLGREDSLWYPTMRLFRQRKARDWTPIVDEVIAELQKFLNGDHSVLEPKRWVGEAPRQNPFALQLPEN